MALSREERRTGVEFIGQCPCRNHSGRDYRRHFHRPGNHRPESLGAVAIESGAANISCGRRACRGRRAAIPLEFLLPRRRREVRAHGSEALQRSRQLDRRAPGAARHRPDRPGWQGRRSDDYAGRARQPPDQPHAPVERRDPRFLRPRAAIEAGRRAGDEDQHSFHRDTRRTIRDRLRRVVRHVPSSDASLPGREVAARLRRVVEEERQVTIKAQTAKPSTFIGRYVFSRDHKIIGLQYFFLALTAALVGSAMSLLMRLRLAWPRSRWPLLETVLPGGFQDGLMKPEFYLAMVTMHGTIMIFMVLSVAPQSAFAIIFCRSNWARERWSFRGLT